MPIKPENRALYPPNWAALSRHIRFDRAGGKCEECGAVNYQPHPVTGSRVILTVAHLDHNPVNCQEGNLKAMCQRCHLAYDLAEHIASRAASRRAAKVKSGQLELRASTV